MERLDTVLITGNLTITIGDATPVPDPDQLFSRLHQATIFTKLDFSKGYRKVENVRE